MERIITQGKRKFHYFCEAQYHHPLPFRVAGDAESAESFFIENREIPILDDMAARCIVSAATEQQW
jgi:hypothetical protein